MPRYSCAVLEVCSNHIGECFDCILKMPLSFRNITRAGTSERGVAGKEEDTADILNIFEVDFSFRRIVLLGTVGSPRGISTKTCGTTLTLACSDAYRPKGLGKSLLHRQCSLCQECNVMSLAPLAHGARSEKGQTKRQRGGSCWWSCSIHRALIFFTEPSKGRDS